LRLTVLETDQSPVCCGIQTNDCLPLSLNSELLSLLRKGNGSIFIVNDDVHSVTFATIA